VIAEGIYYRYLHGQTVGSGFDNVGDMVDPLYAPESPPCPQYQRRSGVEMFELSDKALRYRDDLLAFMDEHIYPAESVYEAQMVEAGDPHFQPAIVEELKTEAKKRGLWNLFHPHPEWGPA